MAGTMRRMRRFGGRWTVVVGMLAMALLLGAVALGGARHAAAMQASAATSCQDQTARLATNLGLTTDKLQAAIKQTRLQDVDTAQTNGWLTATQAQSERDRINADTNTLCVGIGGWGYGPGYGPGPGGPGYGGPGFGPGGMGPGGRGWR